MRGLTKEEDTALRAIAQRYGFTATRGPLAKDGMESGSSVKLLLAIISGEVATILLDDESRDWLIEWLEQQQVDNPLYEDVPKSVARQLRAASERRV